MPTLKRHSKSGVAVTGAISFLIGLSIACLKYGGVAAGSGCTEQSDCAPGLDCLVTDSAQICGIYCNARTECPGGSRCRADHICVRIGTCASEGCPGGSTCSNDTGECVPDQEDAGQNLDAGQAGDAGPQADAGPTDGGCLAAFDLSGWFTVRRKCDERATGTDAGQCVVDDIFWTLIVTKTPSTSSDYVIARPGDAGFYATGALCGTTLAWSGGVSGSGAYTETGAWEFSDSTHFTQPPSSYTLANGQATGSCTAAGVLNATPPAAAPVGACN